MLCRVNSLGLVLTDCFFIQSGGILPSNSVGVLFTASSAVNAGIKVLRLADVGSNMALPRQQFTHDLSVSVFSCVKRGWLCLPDDVDVRAACSDVSEAEPGLGGRGDGLG